MDQEKERQLTMLQEIYDNWTPPTPAFKPYHDGVQKVWFRTSAALMCMTTNTTSALFPRTSSFQKMMTDTRKWKKERSSLTMNQWRNWWLTVGFWTEPQP